MHEEGDKFRIVWNPNSPQTTTLQYARQNNARSEAERLARNEPGAEFYVFGAEYMYTAVDPVKEVKFDYAHPPF